MGTLKEPSGFLARDFWEPRSERVVGLALNLALWVGNLHSFPYIVLAFHRGQTDARSLLNGIIGVSPTNAFLEKADAIVQRYQKPTALQTWRPAAQSSPHAFSPFTPFLLPFLLSFWQSNTDVKSRFAFDAWGKLSRVQMALRIFRFLGLVILAFHLGQMKRLSRKAQLGAGKGQGVLVRGHPVHWGWNPGILPPATLVFTGGSFALFNQTSGVCMPACNFLEKCPSKQLSLLGEGKPEDPRAWDFPGRAFLTTGVQWGTGYSAVALPAFQGPIKMSEASKTISNYKIELVSVKGLKM